MLFGQSPTSDVGRAASRTRCLSPAGRTTGSQAPPGHRSGRDTRRRPIPSSRRHPTVWISPGPRRGRPPAPAWPTSATSSATTTRISPSGAERRPACTRPARSTWSSARSKSPGRARQRSRIGSRRPTALSFILPMIASPTWINSTKRPRTTRSRAPRSASPSPASSS